MLLAAHQANFIPWLPYFDKMNKADIFVMMINCQFEKNGWQNRCEVWDRKWTMPVEKGMKPIKEKIYIGGVKLVTVNEQWIHAIAMTLGIDTGKIRYDLQTEKRGTDAIIELCKHYECDQYLTNPEAMEKYLDEKMMNDEGIEVVRHEFGYKRHVFEMFNEIGIEGTRKLIARDKKICGI